ncbi:MAG: phage portal protein [Ignavibacteriales bacterium]|nr:phage portal protein [Ignavibacteriales bacterium]
MNWKFWRKKSVSVTSNDWFGRSLFSGISIPEEAFEKTEYVYDCIKTRAEKIASIPWGIWVNDKRNEKLETLFKNPNPYQTSTQFLESLIAWLDLRGIAFVYIGNYPNFEIFDADLVSWRYDGNYHFRYVNKEFTDEQVKIIRNFSPYSRLYPISTLQSAFSSVKIIEDYEKAIERLMEKGAYIPAVFTSDQKFTAEQIKQIQDVWRESYSGISNAGNLPVLGGGLKVEKIGLTPADLDILSRENITKDRIYTAFGVPKRDFQNLNRATAEVQQEYFIRTTIMPFADNIAEQITKFILEGKGEFKFDYSQLPEMQGDLLTRAQVEEIHVRSGIRTINEIRGQYGLNPVPWGNDYWANMSLVSFGNYTEQTETLRALKDEIVGIKKTIIENKKQLEAEQKAELRWKVFITRTTPQEQKLEKELNKFFKKLGEQVIEKLNSGKSEMGVITKFNIEDFINMDLIPEGAKDKLIKSLLPYILSFMQQAGDSVVEEYNLGISFNVMTPKIQEWLKWKLENSASEIIKTTQKDLYDALIAGINEGEGIPELSKRIKDMFEATYKNRSKTIARTEVISANNKAQVEAAKEGGMKYKVWLTAIDERTRQWHADVNNQIQRIEDPFIVMGEELEAPGDPKGSPENVINCRCTVYFEYER